MTNALSSTFNLIMTQLLSDVFAVMPKLFASIAVLLIGTALAKALRNVVTKLFSSFKLEGLVRKTPVEHFLTYTGFSTKVEEVVGSIVYWLVMLVTAHTFVSVLGLVSLSAMLDRVISYLPNIVASIVILLFGMLLAGFLENIVKGAVRSFDQKSARLLGKVASYLVMVVSVLAAVSELGIAKDFILILFVGFVAMMSLGLGLAIGLGAKDLVGNIVKDWYQGLEDDIKS